MKKILKVLWAILGVVIFIIILALALTSSLPKAADAMFASIKSGNMQEAYSYTAEQFKSSTTLEQFEAFVEQVGLRTFKNATWTKREIANNQWFLKWTITLENGGTIPMEIWFIKENGEWKIMNMYVPQAGLVDWSKEKADN